MICVKTVSKLLRLLHHNNKYIKAVLRIKINAVTSCESTPSSLVTHLRT